MGKGTAITRLINQAILEGVRMPPDRGDYDSWFAVVDCAAGTLADKYDLAPVIAWQNMTYQQERASVLRVMRSASRIKFVMS